MDNEKCKYCDDGELHIYKGVFGVIHTFVTCNKDLDPESCEQRKAIA